MKEEESDNAGSDLGLNFSLSAMNNDSTKVIDLEFVNKYRTLPALWDSNHKDYTNKYKRNAALDSLVPIMKQWHKSATRYHVRAKINVLRSYYKRILKKHLSSKVIGPDGSVVYTYVPQNWKFEALSFLDGDGRSEVQEITQVDVGDTSVDYQETASHGSTSGNEEEYYDPFEKPQNHRNEVHSTYQYKSRKRSKPNSKDLRNREYEAIAANVACKLQRMNPQQQCLAELLINKVLIGGLKEQLTDDTDLSEVQGLLPLPNSHYKYR